MYVESDYFVINPMSGEIDGPPQTATNYSGLVAMGSSSSSNLEDDYLRLSNISLENLSKTNPSYEEAMEIDLQHQFGFNLEQHNYNTHQMQNILQESDPPLDHHNWEEASAQEMHYNQQMMENHQQQQIGLPHDLQCFNSAPYPNSPYTTPDLLNFLHLPQCSVPLMLPSSVGPNKNPNNYHTLNMFGELPMSDSAAASTVLYDPLLQLSFSSQPPVSSDLFHSHNYSLPASRSGSYFGRADGNGGVFQEEDGTQFENSFLDLGTETPGFGQGQGRGTNNTTTEKQRREQWNVKYEVLRSLIPNQTKKDRASIVADAIDYVKKLLETVKEMKKLVENKRCGRERSKRLKMDEEAAADVESSSIKPLSMTEKDQAINGSLQSSWLLRKSKETVVDVRIIDDEVTIKLTQQKKVNCLLIVAKILDELQLELLQVAGGNIGDYYIFMFNTKIGEGSSVYANTIAKKMIEVLDSQHQSFPARL